MGIYLNPDNIDFQEALNSEIYVDKTGLIKHTNSKIRTSNKYICVSRPRRFGKSMAGDMLVAYYSRGCDSKKMFSKYKIASDADFEKHLNKYNVIHVNMLDFIKRRSSVAESLDYLSKRLIHELKKENGDVDCFDWDDLMSVLADIFNEKKVPFIFVIDEWDCVFREYKNDTTGQAEYLDFLRLILKDQNYVALAYMTGILPIKKYGKHSALNMFTEIAMTNTREYAEFTGFTEAEVLELCKKYDMPFEETKRWYDGYDLKGVSIYNPRSVVMSMTGHDFDSYWTSTETYEALKVYIQMNFDGLREKVVDMIAGEKVVVNTGKFQNDMSTFNSADDVLTLLIHLGYLTYNDGKVWIPNSEVQQEFINSIEDGGWETVMNAIRSSDELIEATIDGDAEKVAELVERAHDENASIIGYNNEMSLSCVISLAYYSARKEYIIHRELATGKGFADLVFIPRKNVDKPAMVIELKWNKSADTAIEQIKRKQYTDKTAEYTGEILLVGISYDAETKKHECIIEKIQK
ncbi:MAG: ATP-binding protein [Ruminococcus sp.]|nr:ATP-binding protein [Ruminococcus sp.]